jgi:hypothetical protein
MPLSFHEKKETQSFFNHLKNPDFFLERHSLFVQANHVMGEYHAGSILLSNHTPFELWEPLVMHALYHASTLLKSLLLSSNPEDFQGWMYEFRLPPKACHHLGIRPGSIDQIVTFWKALFSVRLFKICDHLLSGQPSAWSATPLAAGVDLQEVVMFMKEKEKWWNRLMKWDPLVQSAKCKLSVLG